MQTVLLGISSRRFLRIHCASDFFRTTLRGSRPSRLIQAMAFWQSEGLLGRNDDRGPKATHWSRPARRQRAGGGNRAARDFSGNERTRLPPGALGTIGQLPIFSRASGLKWLVKLSSLSCRTPGSSAKSRTGRPPSRCRGVARSCAVNGADALRCSNIACSHNQAGLGGPRHDGLPERRHCLPETRATRTGYLRVREEDAPRGSKSRDQQSRGQDALSVGIMRSFDDRTSRALATVR